MKNTKFLVLPLLLASLASCASNKSAYKELGKKTPDSYYKMASDTYKTTSYSVNETKVLSTDLTSFSKGAYTSYKYLFNLTTKELYDASSDKVIDTYTEGFDSTYSVQFIVNKSLGYVSFNTRIIVYTSETETGGYKLHILTDEDEYVCESDSKFSLTATNVYYSSDLRKTRIKISSGDTDTIIYLRNEKIVSAEDFDEYAVDYFNIYDSNMKLIGKALTDNYILYCYDKKGNLTGKLDKSAIVDFYDYEWVEVGSKDYLFKTEEYYESEKTKSSETQYKTTVLEIDYKNASLKKYDNAPFVLEDYNEIEKEADDGSIQVPYTYVKYTLLDEDGHKSSESYGTMISDTSFDFDGSYLYDDVIMDGYIEKLTSSSYVIMYSSSYFYKSKTKYETLNNISDIVFSENKGIMEYDGLYVPFDNDSFYDTYKNFNGNGSEYAYSYFIDGNPVFGDITVIPDNYYIECDQFGKVMGNFSFALDYGIAVSDTTVSSLNKEKLFHIAENEEISQILALSSFDTDDNKIYISKIKITDTDTNAVSYRFVYSDLKKESV